MHLIAEDINDHTIICSKDVQKPRFAACPRKTSGWLLKATLHSLWFPETILRGSRISYFTAQYSNRVRIIFSDIFLARGSMLMGQKVKIALPWLQNLDDLCSLPAIGNIIIRKNFVKIWSKNFFPLKADPLTY
jgi:hypothetical protein